jgi:hypothetical protein
MTPDRADDPARGGVGAVGRDLEDDMTDDELRAMIEAATPGPWHVGKDPEVSIACGYFVGGGGFARADMTGPGDKQGPNARLIAAAPDLAAEVLRLRAALRYYASESLWDRDGGNDGMTPMERDGGKRARAALEDRLLTLAGNK